MHYKYIKASELLLPIIHPQAESFKLPLKMLQKTIGRTKELTAPFQSFLLVSSEVLL